MTRLTRGQTDTLLGMLKCLTLTKTNLLMSAGVVLGVNLRNPLHVGNEVCKQGIHPGYETQGRRHRKSKTGVSKTNFLGEKKKEINL